jgi:lipopolysaccharide transport system ATP-binding protein
VLAVGDAAFQKKCLGKMERVATEGRTVLFVSHNMAAVENLCQRVIVLREGEIAFSGGPKEGIEHYFQAVAGNQADQTPHKVDLTRHPSRRPNYQPVLASLEFFNGDGKPLTGGLKLGASLKAAIGVHVERPIVNMDACIGFETLSGQRVFTAHTAFEPNRPERVEAGEQTFICEIPSLILVPGEYKILVAVGIAGGMPVDLVEDAARIEILEADYYGTGKTPWNGLIVLKHHWYLQ